MESWPSFILSYSQSSYLILRSRKCRSKCRSSSFCFYFLRIQSILWCGRSWNGSNYTSTNVLPIRVHSNVSGIRRRMCFFSWISKNQNCVECWFLCVWKRTNQHIHSWSAADANIGYSTKMKLTISNRTKAGADSNHDAVKMCLFVHLWLCRCRILIMMLHFYFLPMLNIPMKRCLFLINHLMPGLRANGRNDSNDWRCWKFCTMSLVGKKRNSRFDWVGRYCSSWNILHECLGEMNIPARTTSNQLS